jgi:LAO/AO transport system kinase
MLLKPALKELETTGKARAGAAGAGVSAARYVDGILGGNRSVLAKAITLIESSRRADRELAEQIIEKCLPASGNSIRVGITGIPGAGKSSLIEALGRHVVTNCGEKVAVLAVDPSSRISGGSILGDKTRMTFLASSDMAFVRPTPTRRALGGVAQHTREAILLTEAAGYRNVFVETVGVGQSETAVRDIVDFFLLVTITGAGDELQGIKRGVMEGADAVVVNKADGDNVRAAEKARADAEIALHYLPTSKSGWIPRTVSCSARTGSGVQKIWSVILEHRAKTTANGWLEQIRRDQNLHWMRENVEEGLMQLFLTNPAVKQQLPLLEQRVTAGQITALKGARKLLTLYEAGHAICGPNIEHRP